MSLVAADDMRLLRRVHADDGLCDHEVSLVVHVGGRRVVVVVAARPVRAEPVEVLHAQVQALTQ